MISRIISGGQTGADIAALEVAVAHQLPHGGWCPKGRRSLAGPIPDNYQLTETPSSDYLQRTEWNVRDSDGTVVLTLAPQASGGSLKTLDFTRRHHKPALHLSRAQFDTRAAAAALRRFVKQHSIATLNVAGSRESKEPGLHAWTRDVLQASFWPTC